jgi:hypothetical protein
MCLIDLSFCCSSASNSSGTPPPERSEASGAPDVGGAMGALEGCGPQVSATDTASNDGTPIIEVVPEADTTTAAGAVASSSTGKTAAGDHTTTTGLAIGASSSVPGDDDNAVEEEPEVVIGHPGLGAPGQVSVPDAVDTTLFALLQVQDVLQWERRGLEKERQCLVEWGSLLKKWTASKKEKAVEK